ncbi:MAG: GerMN domain-containing protein [Ktedonobacteraceae bacterium]|nr:GerMN domain-containing protein [Ktedonobacteraceae bacterium]
MRYRISFLHLVTPLLLIWLILAACSNGTTTAPPATQGPQTGTAATPTTVATTPGSVETGTPVPPANIQPTGTGYPIRVYFSKFPDSLNQFDKVFPVERTSPTVMVGTYAIQLLIAGPTPKEWDSGYFSELNSSLTGPSNCKGARPVGGPDFTLTMDVKGTQPQPGTFTLRFCRTVTTAGTGADARIQSEIVATLKQFSSVKDVVILTKDGHCFGDMSGKDVCLS